MRQHSGQEDSAAIILTVQSISTVRQRLPALLIKNPEISAGCITSDRLFGFLDAFSCDTLNDAVVGVYGVHSFAAFLEFVYIVDYFADREST